MNSRTRATFSATAAVSIVKLPQDSSQQAALRSSVGAHGFVADFLEKRFELTRLHGFDQFGIIGLNPEFLDFQG